MATIIKFSKKLLIRRKQQQQQQNPLQSQQRKPAHPHGNMCTNMLLRAMKMGVRSCDAFIAGGKKLTTTGITASLHSWLCSSKLLQCRRRSRRIVANRYFIFHIKTLSVQYTSILPIYILTHINTHAHPHTHASQAFHIFIN